MGEKLKNKRWYSCNVVRTGADSRLLWNFAAGRNGFNLAQELNVPAAQQLPSKLVAKDWKVMFQPRLNIALLPVDQVFLRVIHVPSSNFDEILSMVELQLEKLSPLPVTQIAWSIHTIPQVVDNLQTVIVIIVSRALVEDMLAQYEGEGYLADRIEVSMIDQLLATPITEDGAWIYPTSHDPQKFTGLVGWWQDGTLQSLNLLHIPTADNRAALLKEQLSQMAWSGELEGWLKSPPRWHLVADEATVAEWQPMFQTWLGHTVEVVSPLASSDLAGLTANRAAKADPRTSIVPQDYTARYRQQSVDRLWMRGLGAILAVYVFGVIIYLAISAVQGFRADGVEQQMKGLSTSYTNTLQLKARMQIMQERQALKYASLDCWKTIAELLPENITLKSMDFKNGKTLNLNGTAPTGQDGAVTDFSEALQKARVDDQPLFRKVDIPLQRASPGGLDWNFSAELTRGEEVQ